MVIKSTDLLYRMIVFFCITRFTEPGAITKGMTMEDPPITLTESII